MKTILFGLMLLYSWLIDSTFLGAQNFKALESYKNGTVIVRGDHEGTGFVIGCKANRLYILTASHVVGESDRQEIRFFQDTPAISGNLLPKINEEFDIGVLSVVVDQDILHQMKQLQLRKGDLAELQRPEDTVRSIGHPSGNYWVSAINEIANLSHDQDSMRLAITRLSIDDGCSGGPVFDKHMHLIGMLTDLTVVHAVAVKIDPILHVLKSWGIPTNLVQEPPRGGLDTPRISIPLTNRKISYLTTSLGIVTAGAFAWYLVEKNNAEDEFAKYRLATSPEEAVSRRIQTEDARSRCNTASYAFIGSAGIFAVLLVRDLMRSKPQENCVTFLPEKTRYAMGLELNSEHDKRTIRINVHLSF